MFLAALSGLVQTMEPFVGGMGIENREAILVARSVLLESKLSC